MLTCLPKSLCSWDYRVLGASSGAATVEFNHFTEQGGILLGGDEFSIRKHGWLSGHWTLENDGEICAEAQKSNPMCRSFDVRSGDVQLTVKAQSPFTRSFEILSDDSVVGTIQPVHPFTRRASIECGPSVPELVQLFSFWLAALTWRRAAQND